MGSCPCHKWPSQSENAGGKLGKTVRVSGCRRCDPSRRARTPACARSQAWPSGQRRGKRHESFGGRAVRRDFEGQAVFITGASSGIGAALAAEFARQGADVALAARRLDRLEQVATDVEKVGRRAVILSCDVSRDDDVERAMSQTRERLGPVAVAVANAGFGVMGDMARLTLDDYRRQFETNVFGVLRTAQAALPDLRQTRGRLVIVGSVNGYVSTPGASAYGMSKFAVRALAQSLYGELARDGISVVLITPGFVTSEIHEVDNRGRRHPGVPDPFQRLRMPTARAARLIVQATARRRRETVIPLHG